MSKETIDETQAVAYTIPMKIKNKHAVALGRLGGKAGTGKVKARTSAQARCAINVRWSKRSDNKNVKIKIE